jgi:hypothetical protein
MTGIAEENPATAEGQDPEAETPGTPDTAENTTPAETDQALPDHGPLGLVNE